MIINIQNKHSQETQANPDYLSYIVGKLNFAINIGAFFTINGDNIKSRSWANTDIDKVVATFLLISGGLCYFSPDTLSFFPLMHDRNNWKLIWERIRDFDFNNIQININK